GYHRSVWREKMSGSHHEPVFVQGEARYQDARRVTLVGAVVNIVLSVLKILAGWLGSSHALIADGIHSLSDLATDVVVLVAAKHGAKDADDEHPYGHGRIETLATVALGSVLILVAFGIGYDAIRRLFAPEQLLLPGMLALSAAVISVLVKEGLYHYTVIVARKLRSNLLRANAWHHRSDAVSSVVVVVGVIGSMAGLAYLDAVASVVVAVMVAKIGWDLGWHSVHELIDRGLEQADVENIRERIMAVDGVRAMHDLRTRRMGGNAFVDVDVLVDPAITVSEGHRIGEEVLKRLNQDIDEVTDVTVHIDPEDDETDTPSGDAPMRAVILERLRSHWQGIAGADDIESVSLHYFGGKIRVEARIPLDTMSDLGQAQRFALEMAQTAQKDEHVAEVKVLFY
ncbi:MAG: cation transporter, partial [Gammaproteobacteria bacterium]|nr:cation transporter [Gammaproteobacteria bacterium]